METITANNSVRVNSRGRYQLFPTTLKELRDGDHMTWGTRSIVYEVDGDSLIKGYDRVSGYDLGAGSSFSDVCTSQVYLVQYCQPAEDVPMTQCTGVQAEARTEDGPVVSDGGSSTYYFLPKDAVELQDLIEFKDMSFARANIFKAVYRLGEKAGTDALYDVNKIIFFAERMKRMIEAGRSL